MLSAFQLFSVSRFASTPTLTPGKAPLDWLKRRTQVNSPSALRRTEPVRTVQCKREDSKTRQRRFVVLTMRRWFYKLAHT